MYKNDLALHNLQWLICHKPKGNQTRDREKDLDLNNVAIKSTAHSDSVSR